MPLPIVYNSSLLLWVAGWAAVGSALGGVAWGIVSLLLSVAAYLFLLRRLGTLQTLDREVLEDDLDEDEMGDGVLRLCLLAATLGGLVLLAGYRGAWLAPAAFVAAAIWIATSVWIWGIFINSPRD